MQKTQWTSVAGCLNSSDIDMKSNGITTILNWALAVAVVGVGLGATQYYFKTREARSLQAQMVNYQNKQAFLNNLIADTMQYSQRNSSIDPILEAIGAKPGKNAPAAATKPAGK
jgi:ABC-type multidrug transport system fused ATPase/permease subunit